MRYLSVCSGIEAASVAWGPLGWEAAAFAEIDPFPSAVLAERFPSVLNLGDVYDIRLGAGEIDLLVAGFPCQNLSVAGKREGLRNDKGLATHSGLFFRIAELADAIGQRWTVLENVPGLFSSQGGRDFATVVGELSGAEIDVPDGGWENAGVSLGPKGLVEWAVLDAQYFGVPQRRRRVFIVRDTGDWQHRPPIFLERESLRGDIEAREGTGKEVAVSLRGRANSSHREDSDNFIAYTLTGHHPRNCPEENFIYQCHGSNVGPMGTLRTGHNEGGGVPFVFEPCVAFAENQRGELRTSDVAPQLSCGGGKPGSGYTAVQQGYAVRRITPVEAERLQGFPDNWTRIPWAGKHSERCPDYRRYKVIGNSMAVPVMSWLGARIQKIDAMGDR